MFGFEWACANVSVEEGRSCVGSHPRHCLVDVSVPVSGLQYSMM